MIKLTDVLASSRLQGEGVARTLDQEVAANGARRTVYQDFKESEERAGSNAERSPVVLWAKESLHSNRVHLSSKMSSAKIDQPQESAW